jgi:hypothetical protein
MERKHLRLAFSGESGLRAALFVYNRKHGIRSHLKVPRTKFSLSLLVCKHPDSLIDNSVMLIAFLIPFKKTHSVQKKTNLSRKYDNHRIFDVRKRENCMESLQFSLFSDFLIEKFV